MRKTTRPSTTHKRTGLVTSLPAKALLSTADLRDLLQDPAAYPYEPASIDIVQTHISVVALAPPYVYKVKKPVDLGFLDFTTLERRKHFCEQEVRLNQRLCASIYEGVVPIGRTADGALQIEGDGEPIEYAVKMRKLSDEGHLDWKLQQGKLTPADLDRVIETLAQFYHERPSAPDIAEAGRIGQIRINTDENFEQATPQVGELISPPAYQALRYATDRFFDQHALLFQQRRANGHIVNAHGDLRLEHVHLTPDSVCIYDCIEFTERFRHIDVASDIAFLAMELDANGAPELARYVVRQMASALDDSALPLLVDFYKSYRAFVRGKVEGMRYGEKDLPEAERAHSRTRSRRFYRWALRYHMAGSHPSVIVVMGRPGTGKSTQAAALHDALGWPVISSDRTRKQLADVPLHGRPDAETRARLYSPEMTTRTYDSLIDTAAERAQDGKGTILDATFSRASYRDRLRDRLGEHDVPHAFVELTASDEELKGRLAARDAQDDVVSDARAEDFDALAARYEAPHALEDARHVRVSATTEAEATTLSILKALVRMKPG